jgi:hypothetical protein
MKRNFALNSHSVLNLSLKCMTTAMVIANSAIAYCVEFSLQLNFLVISICAGLFFRLFGSALPMATVECSAGTVSGMTPWSNGSELLPEVHSEDRG